MICLLPGSHRFVAVLILATLPALACTPIAERDAGTERHSTAGRDQIAAAVTPRLEIGDAVPTFTLHDTDGNQVDSSAWRGEVVVLTFFETRSPETNLCLELVDRLATLRAVLLPDTAAGVRLVVASVDTAHDGTEILRPWAAERGILGDRWTVGRLDPDTSTQVLGGFGVVTWGRADGSVGHTLNTVVIDPRGRLVDQFPGTSGWSTRDVLAATTAAAAH